MLCNQLIAVTATMPLQYLFIEPQIVRNLAYPVRIRWIKLSFFAFPRPHHQIQGSEAAPGP